ncbi:hypothetical protein [Helicobacter rodentium]|uniref:hypothetical protein n=1 Tax=Helicobacter rodentium TaxID=59617 RepID=UPI0026062297|nr:hypothetical protein [Helicobacter rodentium]
MKWKCRGGGCVCVRHRVIARFCVSGIVTIHNQAHLKDSILRLTASLRGVSRSNP